MSSPAPESAPHGRSAWQDAEPLGVYQPLTSRLATGNLASQLNFIQPLGSRSLSVLQPQSLLSEQTSIVETLGQPFEDFPFFEAPQQPEPPRASQSGMAEPTVRRSPQQSTAPTSPSPSTAAGSLSVPNPASPTRGSEPPAHPGSVPIPAAIEAELPSISPVQKATADPPVQRSDNSAQLTPSASIPGADTASSQPNSPPSGTPTADIPQPSQGSTREANDAARSDITPDSSSSSDPQEWATSSDSAPGMGAASPLQDAVRSPDEDTSVADSVSENVSVAEPIQAKSEESASSNPSADIIQRQTAPTHSASSPNSPVTGIAAAETPSTAAPANPIVDETLSIESGSDTVLAREATTPSITSPSTSGSSEGGVSASIAPSASDAAAPDWVQRDPIASSPAAPDLTETSIAASNSTEPDTTSIQPKSDASTPTNRQTALPQPAVPSDAGVPSRQPQSLEESDIPASERDISSIDRTTAADIAPSTPTPLTNTPADPASDTLPLQRQISTNSGDAANVAARSPQVPPSGITPPATESAGIAADVVDMGSLSTPDAEQSIQAAAAPSTSEPLDVLASPDRAAPSNLPSPASSVADAPAIQRQTQVSEPSPIERPEAPQSNVSDTSAVSDDALTDASTSPTIAAIDSVPDAATAIQRQLPSSEGTDFAGSSAIPPETTASTSSPSRADNSDVPLSAEPPSEAPTPSATVTPNLSSAAETIQRSPTSPTPDVPADSLASTANVEPSAASPAEETIQRSPATTASNAPTELVVDTPDVESAASVDTTTSPADNAIQRSLTTEASATSTNAEPDTTNLSDALPPHPGTTLPDSISSTLPAIDAAVQRSPETLTDFLTPSELESPLASGQSDRIAIDEPSTLESSISRDAASEVSEAPANLATTNVDLPSEIDAQPSPSVVNTTPLTETTSVEPVVQRRQSESDTPESQSITANPSPAVQEDRERVAATDAPLSVQASSDEESQASQPTSPTSAAPETPLAASAEAEEVLPIADTPLNIPTSESAALAASANSDPTSLAPIQPLMDADTEQPFLSQNQTIQRSLALPQVVQDLGVHTPLRSPQTLNPALSETGQTPSPEASFPQPSSMPVNQAPERSLVSPIDLLTTDLSPSESQSGEMPGSGAAEQPPIQRRLNETADQPAAPAADLDTVDASEEPSNQLPTQSWDSVAALLAQFPTVSADASTDSSSSSGTSAQAKFAPQLTERSVVPARAAQDSFPDLHAADTPAPSIQRSPVSQAAMPSVSPTVIQRFATDDANAGGEQDRQEVSGEAASSGGTSPEALDQLAQVMYRMVRQRLLIERERLGRSGSGRFQ